eukprot:2165398-Prymnesium_polylepis.1
MPPGTLAANTPRARCSARWTHAVLTRGLRALGGVHPRGIGGGTARGDRLSPVSRRERVATESP